MQRIVQGPPLRADTSIGFGRWTHLPIGGLVQMLVQDNNDCDDNTGFTLIELLIVIVILGILASVVVFAVRGVTDDGAASVCAADERTLLTAVEAYYANFQTNALPSSGALVDEYEQTLIAAGLLRKASIYWDVTGTGGVELFSPSSC
jgi:prepilin-type N-terminal cleavage/methylation domain-containing protein